VTLHVERNGEAHADLFTPHCQRRKRCASCRREYFYIAAAQMKGSCERVYSSFLSLYHYSD